MEIFTASTMFQISILLYLSAAFASLIFIKWHKLCNIVSNTICIIASVFGLIASLVHIFLGKEKIVLEILKSTIPFVSINITIDNLSAFFLLGLSVLVLCVSLYSIGYISHYYGKRNVGLFNFLYSTFILSMIFVMSAGNAVFFLIAWEAMSLISYFLVVFESEKEDNQRAGTLYIIMTHIGTAFLLIAFMIMFGYTKSFDIFSSSVAISALAKNLMFVLFLIGFGTKAGVVPVHIWLPYAHPAAPSNISALMSGIMIKTAIYGILRFVLLYLGIENTWWGIVILIVGIFSSVFGVAYAFVEKNIKKLLAYSSIENIGIIFIGLGVSFIAFSMNNLVIGTLALIASLFHTFNHTLFKGSLFLGAGSIDYATHTKNMEKLGGLIKKMPLTALFVLGGSLSISALVPFNGFASEWLIYQSLFINIISKHSVLNTISIIAVAVLALSGALTVASYIKLFGISFLGLPRSKQASNAKEVPIVMNIGIGILTSICLVVGLFPMFFIKIIDKVVTGISGQSILGQLQGGFFIAYYPIEISSIAISPLAILAVLVIVILLVILIIRIVGGKYIERKYGTWDCGFEALNSRMQCSAMGFSKSIKIVFKILFRPSRELEVKGIHRYHPDTMEYKVTTESVFEKYLYDPILLLSRSFSKRIKFSVQTGSIHKYLLYIFLAVLVLMLYNRLV